MKMLNRAIEDASAYTDFQKKLLKQPEAKVVDLTPPRRKGESRKEYRLRLRTKEKTP